MLVSCLRARNSLGSPKRRCWTRGTSRLTSVAGGCGKQARSPRAHLAAGSPQEPPPFTRQHGPAPGRRVHSPWLELSRWGWGGGVVGGPSCQPSSTQPLPPRGRLRAGLCTPRGTWSLTPAEYWSLPGCPQGSREDPVCWWPSHQGVCSSLWAGPSPRSTRGSGSRQSPATNPSPRVPSTLLIGAVRPRRSRHSMKDPLHQAEPHGARERIRAMGPRTVIDALCKQAGPQTGFLAQVFSGQECE